MPRHFRLLLPIVVCLLCPHLLMAADTVILQSGTRSLRGGKSGFMAEVQRKLNLLPESCRPTPALVVSGEFGASVRAAIMKAANCADFPRTIPADSPARNGALTEAFWDGLFPDRPAPTAHQRAMVVVLTQEATDYDRAEWNFCQNRPAYDPARGQNVCFSNDPGSYLTWGPRGATAGHGAEVQQIVHAIDSDPRTKPILDASFGSLAGPVRRFLRLNATDTERFLCAAWLDPASRQAWKDAFQVFGSNSDVARVYDAVYESSSFDGQKIERYYQLYRLAGIVPTEVDYGLMLDRATHMSAPSQAIANAARDAMNAAGAGRTPASLRRWLALNHRPGNQRADRLGRDVVFYIDALDTAIGADERTAWMNRNPVRASQAGLRESVQLPDFRAPQLSFSKPPRNTEQLTDAERGRCPAAVLNPRAP